MGIATFSNISVILWQSVLLEEETRGPGENHRPVANHWQTLSDNVVSSRPWYERVSNSQGIIIPIFHPIPKQDKTFWGTLDLYVNKLLSWCFKVNLLLCYAINGRTRETWLSQKNKKTKKNILFFWIQNILKKKYDVDLLTLCRNVNIYWWLLSLH